MPEIIDENLELAGYFNLQNQSSLPPAPASGVNLFVDSVATLPLLKLIDNNQVEKYIQNSFHDKTIFYAGFSSGATAPTVINGTLTTTGTLTSTQALGGSLKWLTNNRKRFTSAATAGASAGFRTAYSHWFRGSAVGFGGFFFRARFGHNLNVNGSQCFIGLCSSSAVLATTANSPSALLNSIGMGYDSSDASSGNWKFFTNDGAGTATKADLGVNAVRSNVDHGYDLIMYCPSGINGDVFVRIFNIQTGASVMNASFGVDIPASNTGLCVKAEINNAAVASAVNLDLGKLYIESDY